MILYARLGERVGPLCCSRCDNAVIGTPMFLAGDPGAHAGGIILGSFRALLGRLCRGRGAGNVVDFDRPRGHMLVCRSNLDAGRVMLHTLEAARSWSLLFLLMEINLMILLDLINH